MSSDFELEGFAQFQRRFPAGVDPGSHRGWWAEDPRRGSILAKLIAVRFQIFENKVLVFGNG
jgi:hypothetical protein